MILYPRDSAPSPEPSGFITAWEAVEPTQTMPAGEWWLVAQPDHGALAGELAARADSALFPEMDERVRNAIALHDAGWEPYDGGRPQGTGSAARAYPSPMIGPHSRPLSFLEMAVEQFVAAWDGSIEKALVDSPLAGCLVSGHFLRIAQLGISRARTARDQSILNAFMKRERARQDDLQKRLTHSREQTSALVDLLQFFDLLSLYACCGSRHNVEFPQKVQGRPVRLINSEGRARLEPQIFPHTVELEVPAHRYAAQGGESAEVELPVALG